jgi:hypothetical protein
MVCYPVAEIIVGHFQYEIRLKICSIFFTRMEVPCYKPKLVELLRSWTIFLNVWMRTKRLTTPQIADALSRFKTLNDVFKTEPDFQHTLAIFYADILEYHIHAYRFVRRSGKFELSHYIWLYPAKYQV